MKKTINKIIIFIIIVFIIFSQNVIFATMADYTDEQADKKLEQEQKEWKQEQEEKVGKSSNNYLKKLSVENYSITPEFDKQTINYEIKEEITDDSITIKAETDDEKASVSGIGKIILNSGENNIEIKVTAENGMVRTYFINVKKQVKQDLKLNNLKITTEDKSEIEITPEFNENIYEYNCEVQSYVEKVDIDANSNIENANIEITGNENLKEGLNQVLITVSTSNDEKVVYKINVTRKHAISQIEDKKQEFNYRYMAIIVFVVIIFIIILFAKRKKGKHNK